MSAPTALITGGTSGIGKATAEVLHRRGYRVAVTGQNPETLAQARKELPDDVLVLEADSRSLDATDNLIAEIRDRFGSLNTLFLNAGANIIMPLEAWDEKSFDDVFATNAKGQFFTLVKALPLLVDGASVILTVGLGSTRGAPGVSVAVGSRGALLTMMPSFALELAPRRIRVNAVSPGSIQTPLWSKSGLAPHPDHRGARRPRHEDSVRAGRHTAGCCRDCRLPRVRRGCLHHRAGDRHLRRDGARRLNRRASSDGMAFTITEEAAMSPFIIVNELQPKSGQRDKVIELLREFAASMHAEPGCVHYSVHQPVEDENGPLKVIQAYSSVEAFQEHVAWMGPNVPRLAPLLQSRPHSQTPALLHQVSLVGHAKESLSS